MHKNRCFNLRRSTEIEGSEHAQAYWGCAQEPVTAFEDGEPGADR